MGRTPTKKLVFVIDEYGRALTAESLNNLISELFEKALKQKNVDATVLNGYGINNSAYFAEQIAGKDISEWEVIYFHGSKYPPALLTVENKENLSALLPTFNGTSAEAIYKVLSDAEAYRQFD